jgi:signal transduction histidine kinase
MKSLYLRIWLTVVAVLALFALGAGWLMQRHLDQERVRAEAQMAERLSDLGELLQRSLPVAAAPQAEQAQALVEWAQRLHLALALDDAQGQRVAASDNFLRREAEGQVPRRGVSFRLSDGRRLWMLRPPLGRLARIGETPSGPPHGEAGLFPPDAPPSVNGERPPEPPRGEVPGFGGPAGDPGPGFRPDLRDGGAPLGLPLPFPREWPAGVALAVLLAGLFLAVAGGAWPVVRGLTRRLEELRHGVERFGSGALDQRVPVKGRDEVAVLATSFNQAASRIESLMQANQSLLANASHELRSPLARLKMAVAMLDSAGPAMRVSLTDEIHTNIGELDALVEEVLLSSRLQAGAAMEMEEPVDLLGLAVEEAARVDAQVDGEALVLKGSERLLRRALRNLLENARRYGNGTPIETLVSREGAWVRLQVCDHGPGVPPEQRERIFEPFFRLPGHAEREGGVGLGLALVRQIVQRHEGSVHCEGREGGGSCFVIRLPGCRLVRAPGASTRA